MNYAKVVDGALIEAPRNLKLDDGNIIFNFNYDVNIMKEHGFKPIEKNIPNFNTETESVCVENFIDNGNHIVVNYKVIQNQATLKNRVESLEELNVDIIATTFDMDYRLLEVEWALEDTGITGISLSSTFNLNRKGEKSMALSRYEQAKIIILGDAYYRPTFEKQLTTYLKRGYLTQEEYDTLIAMMDARETIEGE